MGEKALSFRAAGWRRGQSRYAGGGAAVIVVAVVIASAGTACTAVTSAPVTAGTVPRALIVLQQGADNGNGDISSPRPVDGPLHSATHCHQLLLTPGGERPLIRGGKRPLLIQGGKRPLIQGGKRPLLLWIR